MFFFLSDFFVWTFCSLKHEWGECPRWFVFWVCSLEAVFVLEFDNFQKISVFANTLRNKSCTLVKCKKETFLISLNWRRKQEMNQDVVFYLKSYSFYLFKRNMFSKLFEFQFKVSIIVTKYIYLIPSFEVCKRRKHFKMEFLKNFPF